MGGVVIVTQVQWQLGRECVAGCFLGLSRDMADVPAESRGDEKRRSAGVERQARSAEARVNANNSSMDGGDTAALKGDSFSL